MNALIVTRTATRSFILRPLRGRRVVQEDRVEGSLDCGRRSQATPRQTVGWHILTPMKTESTRVVFLCYSRRDRGIVLKCQAVIRAAGMIPWRDQDSIPPGANW